MKLLIELSDEQVKVLEKRAKDQLFTLEELAEDILRRSAVNTKNKSKVKTIKIDDKLVGAFSRQKSGRPKKKK